MKSTSQYRILLISAIGTFLAMLVLLAYVFYLALWDFKTIDLYNTDGELLETYQDGDVVVWEGLEIDKKEIEAGSVNFYTVNYCRHTEAKVDVEKHLVDGILIELGDTDLPSGGSFESGCHTGLKLPFYVSDKIPAGEYRLRARIQYDISPLQDTVVFFYTEPFNVIQI